MTGVLNDRIPLRERKKQATRARIIDVALRMFGQRGFESPTVEEIAAAAEVGKGTIYNYFRTKEEIVVAFMVDVEKRVQEQARRFARAEGEPEEILERYVRYHLRVKEPYRDFLRVLMAQFFLRGAGLYPRLGEMQAAINSVLSELFESLQKRGLLRHDVKLPELIEIFKMVHFGVAMVWLTDSPPYRGTYRLLKEEMRLFCRGLAAPKSAAR